PIVGGIDYRGAIYKARVSEEECSFGSVPSVGSVSAAREFNMEFGSPRIEQGSVRLEPSHGRFARPAFGLAQLDRGTVIEEYLFENRRIEQIFRLPAPVSEGALRLAIPVKTDLAGSVTMITPVADGWQDFEFKNGAITFQDANGTVKLSYHTAVVVD